MTLEERLELLEKEVQRMKDIEDIKRLKSKYLRCLDSKDWEGFAETLSPNVHTSYSNGKLVFDGPDQVTAYISKSMPRTEITMHMGHMPEISFEGDTLAVGRWTLEDNLIFCEGNEYSGTQIQGGAFYTDKYEKVDGKWRILETGYVRIYEEMFQRDSGHKITQNMHQPSKLRNKVKKHTSKGENYGFK